MRIGISSPMDISVILPYIGNINDKEKVKDISVKSQTPAVDTLIVSLLERGHFLRLFTMGTEDFYYHSNHVEIYVIKASDNYIVRNTWSSFDKARRINKVISQNYADLDVLHAHWTYEYAYAIKDLSSKIPVVCTVRDWAPLIWRFVILKDKPLWTFKYIMARRVFRCKEMTFVANSPYTSDLLKRIGISAPVIPNSIKNIFFDNVKRHDSEPINVLCISSSDDKRKNIITLLRAFKILREKYPMAKLLLVGGCFTPYSVNYKKYSNENLLDNVELCGFANHEDIMKYLDQSTVFVTPSLEETFGNTLLESIARKVPTIGGIDSGAVPYVLCQGDIGYLCDVTNPNSLSEMIYYVLSHREESVKKSEYAYNYIKEKYSENSVAKQYEQLYNRVISINNNV